MDGKRHYGDGLYQEAARILGLEVAYLRQLKSLAVKYELLDRSNRLSWKHHKEVASIKRIEETNGKLQLSKDPDQEKMQEFLSLTGKESRSVRDLRQAVATYKRRQHDKIRLANEKD